MSEQLSIKELMDQYGYAFTGSCNCDGYETWKYKKDGYRLKWRKRAYTFTISQGRQCVLGWTKVIQLAETLKKLHEDVAIL